MRDVSVTVTLALAYGVLAGLMVVTLLMGPSILINKLLGHPLSRPSFPASVPVENGKVGQFLLSTETGELKWKDVSSVIMTVKKTGVITWPVEGKEWLQLEPTSRSGFRLVVLYDGAERGELLRVEYGSGVRTVSLPNRPPAGWMIGGRR